MPKKEIPQKFINCIVFSQFSNSCNCQHVFFDNFLLKRMSLKKCSVKRVQRQRAALAPSRAFEPCGLFLSVTKTKHPY